MGYNTENQGWMLKNSCPKTESQVDELTKQVRSLFDSHHRCSSTRLRWVLLWTGITKNSTSIATIQECKARIRFLNKLGLMSNFVHSIQSKAQFFIYNQTHNKIVLCVYPPQCLDVLQFLFVQRTLLFFTRALS